MSLRLLGKQSLIYGVGHVAVRGVTFLLLPLYTNIFSLQDYGVTWAASGRRPPLVNSFYGGNFALWFGCLPDETLCVGGKKCKGRHFNHCL